MRWEVVARRACVGVCSCVWHDGFMCVTWLLHTCGMTHSYVGDDCVTIREPCLTCARVSDRTRCSLIFWCWLLGGWVQGMKGGGGGVCYWLFKGMWNDWHACEMNDMHVKWFMPRAHWTCSDHHLKMRHVPCARGMSLVKCIVGW